MQASKAFYNEIYTYLKNNEFVFSPTEPCLEKKRIGKELIIVGIYVDDILLIGDNKIVKKEIEIIKRRYSITQKHPLDEYVGCQMVQTNNYIILHQQRLIDKLKDDFQKEIKEIKTPMTPMTSNTHVVRPEEEDKSNLDFDKQKKYQSGVGTLLYFIKHSRPDIFNSVRELTKAMDRANNKNYKQMLRVIKYVVSTRNFGVKLTAFQMRQYHQHVGNFVVTQTLIMQATRSTEKSYLYG